MPIGQIIGGATQIVAAGEAKRAAWRDYMRATIQIQREKVNEIEALGRERAFLGRRTRQAKGAAMATIGAAGGEVAMSGLEVASAVEQDAALQAGELQRRSRLRLERLERQREGAFFEWEKAHIAADLQQIAGIGSVAGSLAGVAGAAAGGGLAGVADALGLPDMSALSFGGGGGAGGGLPSSLMPAGAGVLLPEFGGGGADFFDVGAL